MNRPWCPSTSFISKCCAALFAASFAAAGHANPLGLLFPIPYSGYAIKAKIVDARTKQPLPGVMVMGIWRNVTPAYLVLYSESAQYSCDQLVNIESAMSGVDGRFELPAWLGKWGHCQYMPAFDPSLVIYKPGYRAKWLTNSDDIRSEYADTANPSSSRWDGQTIEMEPLGHHYFGTEDNHISNLKDYSDDLGVLVSHNAPNCFWKEARPAVLMLLQEERRLRSYQKYDFGLFERWLTPPQEPKYSEAASTCGDQTAYIEDLEREASTVMPEVPPKPFIVDYGDAVRNADPRSWWDLWAGLSDELPSAADMAPGGILEHGLLYKLALKPDNPGFIQATVLMPRGGEDQAAAQAGFAPKYLPNQPGRQVFEASCVQYFDPDAAQYARDAPHYPACSWIIAIHQPISNNRWFEDSYDEATRTWSINSHVLIRPTGFSAPEILELDSDVQLDVTTTLKPAGPNRWQLPPEGQDFTLGVQATNTAVQPIHVPLGVASACAQALPEAVRQLILDHFASWKLSNPTNAGGGADGQPGGCGGVMSGHFTDDDNLGYAFYLADKWVATRRPLLVVATPAGTGWRSEVIETGCTDITTCRLALAPRGLYAQSTQWPPSPTAAGDSTTVITAVMAHSNRIARIRVPVNRGTVRAGHTDGRSLAQYTANHEGILESIGAGYQFANFYADGKWMYVVVDDPGAKAISH